MVASNSHGETATYILYDSALPAVAMITDDRLAGFTERHKFRLASEPAFEMAGDLLGELQRRGPVAGVIVKLDGGVPSRALLKTTRQLLAGNRRVYYFWPHEGAVEVVDDLRLKSFKWHWLAYQVHRRFFAKRQATAAEGAAASAVALSGGASVADGMKTSAATIAIEAARWRDLAAKIADGGRGMEASAAAIKLAKASGSAAELLTDLETCCGRLEGTMGQLAQARLAVNRVGFCFDDLAKAAEHPTMAGEIDPPHLRGIRQSVGGAGQQIHDVEAAFSANLPGIRNTAEMVRTAMAHGSDKVKAAALEQVIHENVAVVLNLAGALGGYCKQIADTASIVLPPVAAGRDLVIDKLKAREAAVAAQPAGATNGHSAPVADEVLTRTRMQLATLGESIKPVPLRLERVPDSDHLLAGTGVYLRTDYWAPIISGGSYGHTVYQARALARTTERFHCVTSNRFPLLDELGLAQTVVRPEGFDSTELSLVRANDYYYQALKPAMEMVKPAYIFERACLGNFVGARLSAELQIPYLVEYNGSEISMKRSFDTGPYQLEDVYLAAEEATFKQATLISVISDAVRDDVVKRGIDPAKVLVNWNAVDLEAYGPLPQAKRHVLRTELGFSPQDRVVCFIGTFGGWHGIEVLADAMPRITKACPEARFLLIGEGNFKHLVRDAIEKHGLASRVVDCGRVPQVRGAELMGAADVFVSPHSSHMVDSRFFGSPTKLFEYMAYGVGIVASDLEQIGEIMRPSLTVSELANANVEIADARGVLCRPGDLDQFSSAVIELVRRPDLATGLGRNARRAAERHFTWDGHVAKLWQFLARRSGLAERTTNGQSAPDRLSVH
ncbi:MAG: glycosyltransferase [Hyphomicrobiaceae bacterium]